MTKTFLVTPTWNCGEHFYHCAVSVLRHTPVWHNRVWEWVIVENGSKESHRTYVHNSLNWAGRLVKVHLIQNEQNLGIPVAQNQALDKIETLAEPGSYGVVFLDADTAVTPEWLDKMLAVVEKDPKVGIVGGARPPHGPSLPVYFHTNGRWYQHADQPADYPEGEGLDFAGVYLRPELLARGLRMDTAYKIYDGHDQDMGFRVRSWGYRLIQIDAGILHTGQVGMKESGYIWEGGGRKEWDLQRAENTRRFADLWQNYLASARRSWTQEPGHVQRMNAKLVAEAGKLKDVP